MVIHIGADILINYEKKIIYTNLFSVRNSCFCKGVDPLDRHWCEYIVICDILHMIYILIFISQISAYFMPQHYIVS